MDSTRLVFIGFVAAFTLVAAIMDWRTKRLPNALTVPAFVLALVFHSANGWFEGGALGAGKELLVSLGGFATGFGILFVLWLIAGGGGGDVKLMGAVGAWLGIRQTIYVFILATLVIIVGTIGILAYRSISNGFGKTRQRYLTPLDSKAVSRQKSNGADAEQTARLRRRLMPFGVSVAVATWALLAFTVLVKQA
ncbi:MAG: prepilin peptidase [Planctomycetales bacterium]|nr:prepilin peptidase [Planctomycetales bacterium]